MLAGVSSENFISKKRINIVIMYVHVCTVCNIPIPGWSPEPPVLLPPMPSVVYAVLGEPLVLLCRHLYHNHDYHAWWTDNRDQGVLIKTASSPFCVSERETGERKAMREQSILMKGKVLYVIEREVSRLFLSHFP